VTVYVFEILDASKHLNLKRLLPVKDGILLPLIKYTNTKEDLI